MNIYEIDTRIAALSHKIKSLTRSRLEPHLNTLVKQENLKYNFSNLISNLVSHIEVPTSPSPTELDQFLQNYNAAHGTNFTADHFLQKGWIRIINFRIVFPQLVQAALRDQQKRKEIVIPESTQAEIACLLEFNTTYPSSYKALINSTTLTTLFSEHETNLLLQKKVIQPYNNNTFEIATRHEILEHLATEITAGIWLNVKEDGTPASNAEKFKRFAEIIYQCELFPRNLSAYLAHKDLETITYEARTFLLNEKDLLDVGNEFQKEWVDQNPYHSHHNMFEQIPAMRIETSSSVAILESATDINNFYQTVLDHSPARSFYHTILNIILNNDHVNTLGDKKYQLTIELLKETRQPYIVYETCYYIQINFPQILPYLLWTEELAPIVFFILEKIEWSDKAIGESGWAEKNRQLHQTITAVWKDSYEIFLSILLFRSFDSGVGRALGEILLFCSKEFLYNKGIEYQNYIKHIEAKKRFEFAIRKLSELRFPGVYSNDINRRLFPEFLRDIFVVLKESKKPDRFEVSSLPTPRLELCTQLLRLCNTDFYKNEVSADRQNEIYKFKKEIIAHVLEELQFFFTAKQKEVKDYHTGSLKKVNLRRSFSHFGLEIMEWGYLYCHLYLNKQFDTLDKKIQTSVKFNAAAGLYNENNREQIAKLTPWLKSLALAFIHVCNDPFPFEVISGKINEFKKVLLEKVVTLSVHHSKNDLASASVNLFDEKGSSFGRDLYYHPLYEIVFKAISKTDVESQQSFINRFFDSNTDLQLLLSALNYFQHPAVTQIITDRIANVDIQMYLESTSISDVESAVLYAINSTRHDIAKPLLERVKSFASRFEHNRRAYENFIFEISLHIALKEKNLSVIQSLEAPPGINGTFNAEANERRQFFIALDMLHNEKKLDDAIEILTALLSRHPKDYEINYNRFHALVLKAYGDKTSAKMLAYLKEWNEFFSSLSEEEKAKSPHLDDQINYSKMFAFSSVGDFDSLFIILDNLPDRLKYDSDIIDSVYTAYVARELYELAFDYIKKAEKYYAEMSKALPPGLRNYLNMVNDEKHLQRLVLSYQQILSLSAANLIKTIPERLNGKRNMPEFLLMEIIKASKLMMEKIKAVDIIKDENKYNDILLALLRFRFPAWGLNISDQPRAGKSPTAKNLGELDFLIKQEDESVAIIEAMILKSKSFDKIKTHVLKCKPYLPMTKYAYMLTYYTSAARFKETWKGYKEDLMKMAYPSNYSLEKKEVNELTEDFKVDNIMIGSTQHKGGSVLYHIFLNISEVK